MSILEVLKFPDPRLRRKAAPIEAVTSELQTLADDMLETMYKEKGIGLAAIQVGVEVRLLVIDTLPQSQEGDETRDRYALSKDQTELEQKVPMPLVIFNPVITKREGKTTFEEGCLSVPGYFETIQRSNFIEVQGLDRDGQTMELQLDGLLSICMQHEIDHLDGKVFIDRLSPIKSNRLKAKIKKLGYPDPKDADADDEEPQNPRESPANQ